MQKKTEASRATSSVWQQEDIKLFAVFQKIIAPRTKVRGWTELYYQPGSLEPGSVWFIYYSQEYDWLVPLPESS